MIIPPHNSKKSAQQFNNSHGFTLIELSIAMVLIAILSAIAIPSFSSWLPNLRFQDSTQNLQYDLQLAKMTAIKRNANVVMLINKVSCTDLPDSVPNAGGGYTLFIDDGNGTGTANDDLLSTGETILKTVIMPKNVALCDTDLTGDLIAFLPTGLPKDGNTGKITLNNDYSRQSEISVNISGVITNQ
ncbi:GspH/FimT family pseudopilin [Desulfosediminicola flagellatus]|uniref:GspH/FimT family pseudopilin n=1 Tax=Desulfosediminicola flagellatus TaxID=2569541 RepID=UPI0010AC6939|nr:GspH/FimT family pseudopilin [Desulfosediminicola flagellatus]